MGSAKYAKKVNFQKSYSLLKHMWKKSKMNGHSVHEAPYQNFETHGPWVRFTPKGALN